MNSRQQDGRREKICETHPFVLVRAIRVLVGFRQNWLFHAQHTRGKSIFDVSGAQLAHIGCC